MNSAAFHTKFERVRIYIYLYTSSNAWSCFPVFIQDDSSRASFTDFVVQTACWPSALLWLSWIPCEHTHIHTYFSGFKMNVQHKLASFALKTALKYSSSIQMSCRHLLLTTSKPLFQSVKRKRLQGDFHGQHYTNLLGGWLIMTENPNLNKGNLSAESWLREIHVGNKHQGAALMLAAF